MTQSEKIQNVIDKLLKKENGSIITLEQKFKKSVEFINENRIFGYELTHIEDDVLGEGKDWSMNVSYYKVKQHKH